MTKIRLFFRERISRIDPGNLALKRSTKTFIAILISLAVFWQTPAMAMFAAISSMLISRSQAGFTIAERRFTMLATGILMAILSVPVSLASQNEWVALSYVTVGTFISFFLIGNRVVPDFPVVSLLAISVVELSFSHTFISSIHFGGLFLMTTALVCLIHFVLWPTRPRKRLRGQLDFIISNLSDYNKAIHAPYPDPESGIKITHKMSDTLRKSIGDFRRLWQLFGVKTNKETSIEARHLDIYTGLGQLYEYLILMWQFRVSAWDSALYKNLIIENESFNEIISYLVHRHNQAMRKPDDNPDKLKEMISTIGSEFLKRFKSEYNEETHREWVAIINTYKALETLFEDLQRMNIGNEIQVPEFSVSEKFHSFYIQLKAAFRKLRVSNSGFRLGARAATIIGITQAYSSFYKPEYAYWLVLFAVLLIRPNLGISIKAGKERFLGTIAGSLLALGFVIMVPATNTVYFIFLFLSVFFMLWFINLNRMILMVTALTFMIVALFNLLYHENNNLVWLRISYTFSIVLLVVFGSFLMWPEKARKKFATTLANAIELEKNYFANIISAILSGHQNALSTIEKQRFRDQIQQLNDVIEATRNEVWQEKVIAHGLNIRLYIMRLINTLQSLDTSSQNCTLKPDYADFKRDLLSFAEAVSKAFDTLISALRNDTTVSGFPDLNVAFSEFRKRFREIKYSDGEIIDNITLFWKNSTFVWNLNPLILELEGIKKEIEEKNA